MDAPTKGLAYTASPSGLMGTTDANGTFSYRAGDTVAFSLSLGGAAAPLAIGSLAPVAPTGGGTAIAFVLAMNNGIQVAQVLQSLNHGTSAAIDVSGLTLPAADQTSLSNFVASGGTTLPTGAATDVAMLSLAQTHASGAASFVVPGGTSATTALSSIQTSLQSMTPTSGPPLASVLPAAVVFHQGSVTRNGATRLDTGITNFKADGTVASVSANSGQSISTGASYTTSGSTLTISGGGLTDTIKVSYVDSNQGLWTDSATDGTTGSGSYVFLQTTFGLSTIAGKTLTLTGSLGNCGTVPFQLVIGGAGSSFQANCQGRAAGSNGTGTVSTTSLPGVLQFTSATGTVHYVGLTMGSTIAKGSVAVVESSIDANPSNGVFGVTAQ